jgi:hypothetical protein
LIISGRVPKIETTFIMRSDVEKARGIGSTPDHGRQCCLPNHPCLFQVKPPA